MLKLKTFYKEWLEKIIRCKGCPEECTGLCNSACPISIFNNDKMSCYEIAKEFNSLLENNDINRR